MSENKYTVLDNGFIKLVDFMGGDSKVLESARVSFKGVSKGEEADRKLLVYLLNNAHLSPFEHSIFQFHVKCPIFIARQWMRHRWGSYNEISGRYTEAADDFYLPSEFRAQALTNKQSSVKSDTLNQEAAFELYNNSIKVSYNNYKELLALGVAKEMARMVLPVSQYTQFYWTINARSLMNFLSLRNDAHAQAEIRAYAKAISEIFKQKMPWTYEAFETVFKGQLAADKIIRSF